MSRELGPIDLKIYVYLLESRDGRTVREIAEALGIPRSSVHYHLKKLVETGIVERDRRGYRVREKISIRGYVIVKNKLIPRLLVYSFFFLGVFLGELFLLLMDPRIYFERITLILVSIIAFIILFYEGLRIHML